MNTGNVIKQRTPKTKKIFIFADLIPFSEFIYFCLASFFTFSSCIMFFWFIWSLIIVSNYFWYCALLRVSGESYALVKWRLKRSASVIDLIYGSSFSLIYHSEAEYLFKLSFGFLGEKFPELLIQVHFFLSAFIRHRIFRFACSLLGSTIIFLTKLLLGSTISVDSNTDFLIIFHSLDFIDEDLIGFLYPLKPILVLTLIHIGVVDFCKS